jgi:hypothetical protein
MAVAIQQTAALALLILAAVAVALEEVWVAFRQRAALVALES